MSQALSDETTDSGVADDMHLVRRSRAGDLDAFAEIVRRHRGLVTRVAARTVGEDDAEDIAQETFLRVYHRLDQFRGEAPFRAWLLRITTNTALTAINRKNLEAQRAKATASEAAETPEPERRAPAGALEAEERRERLREKLLLLTPPHRAVLVLRDLEGLSYDEIATATEAPLGSVKGRLFRARRELIDLLRRNTYDWELPN